MLFDEKSVQYVRINYRGLRYDGFDFVGSEQIEENSRHVLIVGSGLPEAILRCANEPMSPNVIQVIGDKPLAEAIRTAAALMPGIRGSAEIILGASPFAERI